MKKGLLSDCISKVYFPILYQEYAWFSLTALK